MELEDNNEEKFLKVEADSASFYRVAGDAMKAFIKRYLALSKQTHGFLIYQGLTLSDRDDKLILIAGYKLDLNPDTATTAAILNEIQRNSALVIETEEAITRGVYEKVREYAAKLVEKLWLLTDGCKTFSPELIKGNPDLLAYFQQLAGLRSKSELKREIGNVSDQKISSKAATKLFDRVRKNLSETSFTKEKLAQSVEPMFEGVVRDLVGKVMLESVVADALDSAGVKYMREAENEQIVGVVYSNRSDFVMPTAREPLVFIEVRKSSTRHASLYAKDKMFSAINWKGKHPKLLGVLIVEGPWTQETLRTMGDVFDYVIPLSKSTLAAEVISSYLKGDVSKLKWIITFKVEKSPQYAEAK